MGEHRVALALAAIKAHAHDRQLTVGYVADSLGVSRSYLSRVVTKMTGMSMRRHLLHARIALAKRILVASAEPLKAVAPASGFESAASLGHAFVRATGCTPGQFRKCAARAHSINND